MLNQDLGTLDKDVPPRKRTRHANTLKDEDEPDTAALSLKTMLGANSLGGKTRAKAADYDVGTRSIIQTAIEIYCALLLSNDPYAPHSKEVEWAKSAWDLACRHHEVDHPCDTTLLKLVSLHSL